MNNKFITPLEFPAFSHIYLFLWSISIVFHQKYNSILCLLPLTFILVVPKYGTNYKLPNLSLPDH